MKLKELTDFRGRFIIAMRSRGWNSHDVADATDLSVAQVRDFLFGDYVPAADSPIAAAIKSALGL